MKAIKNFIIITLPVLLILFLLLEVFFRVVIPASNKPWGYFDEDEKLFRHDNSVSEGVYTVGRFARIRANWRINNFGWNSPIDYDTTQKNNLIAIIGDSFIQAFEVDVDKSYPSILRKKLNNQFEVYSFGRGGYPLSQYLHVSRYVNRLFDPEIVIFNLVHNDFDESIVELKQWKSHMMQLSIDSDGNFTETNPGISKDHPINKKWVRIANKSALLRYLVRNLNIMNMSFFINEKNFEANIDVEQISDDKDLLWSATSYLISKIKEENRDRRVIIVMDAPRNAIYENRLEESKVSWMNEMVELICLENELEFIDLTVPMAIDYMKNSERFSFEMDGHWNEYGHKFVASIVFNYLQSTSLTNDSE